MPCEKQKSTAILSARRVRTSGREWESAFANGYECGEDSLPSVVLWTAEKGDPTGTVGTRLCPAKYSVLHRNNAVAQNRSFESPLRRQCSSAMKRADADTGARAVATASVVAVFFSSPYL